MIKGYSLNFVLFSKKKFHFFTGKFMVGKEKNIILDRKSGNFNGYDDVAAYFFLSVSLIFYKCMVNYMPQNC